MVGIQGNGGVSSVKLDSGEVIAADMVFMNVGAAPNLELAREMGLEIGRFGVKVNAFLETSDPDVLAAGDCADNKHFVTGTSEPRRPAGTLRSLWADWPPSAWRDMRFRFRGC